MRGGVSNNEGKGQSGAGDRIKSGIRVATAKTKDPWNNKSRNAAQNIRNLGAGGAQHYLGPVDHASTVSAKQQAQRFERIRAAIRFGDEVEDAIKGGKIPATALLLHHLQQALKIQAQLEAPGRQSLGKQPVNVRQANNLDAPRCRRFV